MSEKKFNLYIELEKDGTKVIIKDNVNIETFNLENYIFEHDLELYNIIAFKLDKEEKEIEGK